MPSSIEYFSLIQQKYSYNKLNKLRKCRNNLIHNKVSKNKFLRCTKDILNFLEHELLGKNIVYLDMFERQYIHELLKDKGFLYHPKYNKPIPFDEIKADDFFNLYLIRDKFLSLKKELESDDILTEAGFNIANVSHVDGTSGYVWLSLYKNVSVPKVAQSLISILLTPESLRIYFDFGGKNYSERRAYLNLLKSDKIEIILNSINDKKYFYMFDIEWYHTIISKVSFNSIKKNIDYENINYYIDMLRANEKNDNTITWNKSLMGYIIPRQNIAKKAIKEKIYSIAKIYTHIRDFT